MQLLFIVDLLLNRVADKDLPHMNSALEFDHHDRVCIIRHDLCEQFRERVQLPLLDLKKSYWRDWIQRV